MSYFPRLDAADVSNTVGKYATKDTCNNVPHEPGTMSQRLLRSSVPHGYDNSQTWTYSSFRGAKEEADSQEAFSVEARSR